MKLLTEREQVLVMLVIFTVFSTVFLLTLRSILKQLQAELERRNTDHLLGGHPLDH